jgi:signal transduction histidine kinase
LSEEILPLSEADTMSRLPAVLTAIVPEPITLALSISVSPGSLAAEQATLITRVARELVRNAVHHAGPTTITVALDTTGPVTLTITDNGAGFDTSRPRPPGHLGLLLIDQLVADAQGTFTLYSHPTQGTEARIRLPTTPHHPVPR